MPSGRGMLSVGFEGADGASGSGFSFGYRTGGATLLLRQRSLEAFTLIDDVSVTDAQASVALGAWALSPCATAGAEWTSYDNKRLESTRRHRTDPDYEMQRTRVGGPYQRLRIPVGVGIGREFRIGARLSLVPFVQPALVFERESYTPDNGPELKRSGWGPGVSGGVAAAFEWLVVRAVVSHAETHERSLSSTSNSPTLSVHAGVRF